MPWTPAQHRLFAAVAAGAFKRKGLSRERAARMAAEGVDNSKPARVGRLRKLKKRRR